jgi:hypothetical protein
MTFDQLMIRGQKVGLRIFSDFPIQALQSVNEGSTNKTI